MPAGGAPLSVGLPGEIAARLEADIIRLRYAPAAWLREEDVAARFGVSRSPVREAMRLLESDGLLLRHPRRGTQVAPLSLVDLDHVTECRLPLEGLAAAGMARQAEAADIVRLANHVAAIRDTREPEAALAANIALTGTLHESCGNPVLRELLRRIDKPAQRYRFHAYQRLPDLMRTSADANQAILDAVVARDPETARALTEALVRESWTALRRLFLG